MSQRKMLMGNQAMALGALRAGVRFVSGYPGTPSTEVLETCAKERGQQVYVEWSVNEKAGPEFGGGRGPCRRLQPGHHEAGRPECLPRSPR